MRKLFKLKAKEEKREAGNSSRSKFYTIVTTSLIEKGEAHVFIFLLLLLNSSSCSRGVTLAAITSSRGSSNKGARVLEELLHLISQGEGILGLYSNSEHVLVAIDKGMGSSSQRGDSKLAAQGCNVLDTSRQMNTQVIVSDVQNSRTEERTVVIDLENDKTVGEGLDSKLGKESSFGSTDLFTSGNDLDVGGNFDGTFVNLGRDIQDLEERGLRGIHTGVTSGNGDVAGGNKTHTSWGTDLEVGNGGADVSKLALGENDTDVADHFIQNAVPLVVTGALSVEADATTHQGVLAHEDGGIATDSSTDVHELLGTDIIGVNEESPGVGIHKLTELGVILQKEIFRIEIRNSMSFKVSNI